MELRHLDTLLAIAEEGSFTAAADTLRTVQSNVSEQVRQLEAELGVPLLVRSRKGAEPTEFGLRRARPRASADPRSSRRCTTTSRCCRGSTAGTRASASSGPRAAGWFPRWSPISASARRACGCASTRARRSGCFAEVRRRRARAGCGHRAGHRPPTRGRAPARGGARRPRRPRRRAAARAGAARGARRVPAGAAAGREPAAHRGRAAAADAIGLSLTVPVEVEGIRLIADLVAAGTYASILPETAIPPELRNVRTVTDRRAAPAPAGHGRTHATRSCRSPTRPCATACATWWRSTCVHAEQPAKNVRSRTNRG